IQWEGAFTQLSADLAGQHLKALKELEKAHGIHLITISDRLEERFVKPLRLDRLAALIGPAVDEAKLEGDHPTFVQLKKDLQQFASAPTGVGLDAPAWLRRLEMETQRVHATKTAVAVL